MLLASPSLFISIGRPVALDALWIGTEIGLSIIPREPMTI